MVDGVYDKDPHKYPDAVKYDTLTFADILAKGLQVMDSTAAAMCKDNNIPILVSILQDQTISMTLAWAKYRHSRKIIKIIKKGSFEYETDQGKC